MLPSGEETASCYTLTGAYYSKIFVHFSRSFKKISKDLESWHISEILTLKLPTTRQKSHKNGQIIKISRTAFQIPFKILKSPQNPPENILNPAVNY